MDPCLEDPDIFPDFRDRFVTHINEAVQAQLPEPYYAALARRAWVEVSDRFIQPNAGVLEAAEGRAGPGQPGAVAVAAPAITEPVVIRFISIFGSGHSDLSLPVSQNRAR